jgi:hypothetical protein
MGKAALVIIREKSSKKITSLTRNRNQSKSKIRTVLQMVEVEISIVLCGLPMALDL